MLALAPTAMPARASACAMDVRLPKDVTWRRAELDQRLEGAHGLITAPRLHAGLEDIFGLFKIYGMLRTKEPMEDGLDPALRSQVLRAADAEGFGRPDGWIAGAGHPVPDLGLSSLPLGDSMHASPWIAVRDARPLTPSPLGGEGRDEGAPAERYGNIVAPSPQPSPPWGEGANQMTRAGIWPALAARCKGVVRATW